MGPALPVLPTSCFSGGNASDIPSTVSHAISPELASSAVSRDHGGR
jgi:hypothetical protein